MFNEKFLFGFLNLGDDMLFPDWDNKQYVNLRESNWNESYTTTEDSFIVGLQYNSTDRLDAGDCSHLIINGQILTTTIDSGSTLSRTVYNPTPCFYCKKGTVFKNGGSSRISFLVVPLVKGGGTKRYFIAVGSITGATA